MSAHVHTRGSSAGVRFQVAGIISVHKAITENRGVLGERERGGESKDAAPYGCWVALSAEPYIGYPHECTCAVSTLAPPPRLSTVEEHRRVHARISHCRTDPRIPARVPN